MLIGKKTVDATRPSKPRFGAAENVDRMQRELATREASDRCTVCMAEANKMLMPTERRGVEAPGCRSSTLSILLRRGELALDFKTIGGGPGGVDPKDPIALYETLDRQATHVEPRPAQKQILTDWAARRTERDIVLKLATGAGKTTLGLVMLYSHMVETKRPCVFLCPTNQLVAQVVQEGLSCGVPTVSVLGGEEIPLEGTAGQAVIVTSVQSIFQARAGRWTSAEIYALVIDDAHTAVEIVRQQFAVSIPKGTTQYRDLFALFRSALRDQGRGTAEEIEAGQAGGVLEVPYWVWNEQLDAVTKAVNALSAVEDEAYRKNRVSDARGLPLRWGLIKNCLQGCRCFFSANGMEIAPEIPPVERIPTYHNAARRIFMSATISDEAVLVREMACDPKSAQSPIQTPDAGGIGERMILGAATHGAKGRRRARVGRHCRTMQACFSQECRGRPYANL